MLSAFLSNNEEGLVSLQRTVLSQDRSLPHTVRTCFVLFLRF